MAAVVRGSVFLAYGLWHFTRQGFLRHQRHFQPEVENQDGNLQGKTILITGGSSGLGLQISRQCLMAGARVWILCRDTQKARDALKISNQNEGNLHVIGCDVSRPSDVLRFVKEYRMGNHGPVDILVHNAGVLLSAKQFSADGLEQTFATNLFGPFCLTKLMRPCFHEGTRVINVTSGGMYTQKFDPDLSKFIQDSSANVNQEPFDGAAVYAQTKRLMVNWTHCLRRDGVDAVAVHPGWALTPGVEQSMPDFTKFIESLNGWRSVEEGVDGIMWLIRRGDLPASSQSDNGGCFYLDRQLVPEHLTGTFTYVSGERELEMEAQFMDNMEKLFGKLAGGNQ